MYNPFTSLQLRLDDLSPSAELSHHRLNEFHPYKKQFSETEAFRDYYKDMRLELEDCVLDCSAPKITKPDSEKIQRAFLELTSSLLDSSSWETENALVRRQLKKLETDYKYVMEKFLSKMEKFLHSCENLRENMEKSIGNFKAVSRMTAGVTLVSSALELSVLVGSALHKVFHFGWSPKLYALETLGGSASIAAALFALTYMRWSAADISKEVRDENSFLMDLMMLHRKGNWIDEEILNLFPHGINQKLLDESGSNNSMPFPRNKSWRYDLCYVILLTNAQKDAKLLTDNKFLTKVKMFVRSQAAEVWWNR